jgi:hypothetical protein
MGKSLEFLMSFANKVGHYSNYYEKSWDHKKDKNLVNGHDVSSKSI